MDTLSSCTCGRLVNTCTNHLFHLEQLLYNTFSKEFGQCLEIMSSLRRDILQSYSYDIATIYGLSKSILFPSRHKKQRCISSTGSGFFSVVPTISLMHQLTVLTV